MLRFLPIKDPEYTFKTCQVAAKPDKLQKSHGELQKLATLNPENWRPEVPDNKSFTQNTADKHRRNLLQHAMTSNSEQSAASNTLHDYFNKPPNARESIPDSCLASSNALKIASDLTI